MLHNSKAAEHHAEFGRQFGMRMDVIAGPQARIPCLVTDGEHALRQLIEVVVKQIYTCYYNRSQCVQDFSYISSI